MIKKILIAVVILLGCVFAYAAMLPSEFRISREITISAPAEVIFPFVNEPQKMNSWNPWMKLDPQMKSSYSGPQSGVGAVSSWDGNKEVGTGSATIVESVPNSLVRTKLDFIKPYQSTSFAEVTLKPEGSQTVVSWAINGHSTFVHRLMCLVIHMDKVIGEKFEKGLADLKTLSEEALKEQAQSAVKPAE